MAAVAVAAVAGGGAGAVHPAQTADQSALGDIRPPQLGGRLRAAPAVSSRRGDVMCDR